MLIPGQLPANRSLPAPASGRAEEPAWPFSHATQYVPGEQGQVQPVLKVPYYVSRNRESAPPACFVDKNGARHHALVSPDRTMLRVLDEHGKLEFTFRAPDYVQQVEYQAGTHTYYVRSSQAIFALSGKDGSELATISPEKLSCLGEMAVLDTGDLCLVTPLETFKNGHILLLKPDLSPGWSVPSEIATKRVLDVGQGQVAVFNDGEELAVLNAQGEEVLRSKDPRLYSPIVHNGRLLFLEHKPDKYKRNSLEVVSYEAATGKVTRSPVGPEAERIVPLPEGRFLIEEGELARPVVSVFDSDGELIRRFKFPKDCFLRQMHVSRDGTTALAVTGDDPKALYRLDLQASESGWKLLGGKTEKPQAILVRDAPFLPALFSNGKMAVFDSRGIEIEGRHFSTTSEFLEAMGAGVELASARCATTASSHESSHSAPARLDVLLSDVEKQFKLPSARLASPALNPYVTTDGCMNFPLPALGAMPMASQLSLADTDRVLRGLLREQSSQLTVFDDWKLELSNEKLSLCDPEGVTRSKHGLYTAALPLRLGEEKFVAAVGEGSLIWLRPRKWDFEEEVYSLGEPIASLTLSPDGRSVVATTVSGARLDFTPPGSPAMQQAEALPDRSEARSGVLEGSSMIQVGGVTIRKRRPAS